MIGSPSRSPAHTHRDWLVRTLFLAGALTLVMMVLSPSLALGGQASSGELLFYPCTSCHPVTLLRGTDLPTKKLPNGFKGHDVALVGHDSLGRGSAACLVCHDDPSKNPGMLKLADGTLVEIKGDVALVCYRCHSTKYKEWKAGTHGRRKGKCTAAGCHDPHTPQWIYADPLRPFVGNGFQFKPISDREPFMPLARPAPPPQVESPSWFVAVAYSGLVVVGGLTGWLVMGRRER